MKHNTHIYIAVKAIEFMSKSIENLRMLTGDTAPSKTRTRIQALAVDLQRLLRYHQSSIMEASWTPDDVLNDKSLYHVYKLYTAPEFADAESFAAETQVRNGRKYYRIRGGGGLPYKVDHLARAIADLAKLRVYNDHFSLRQIMYLYCMISHYVVDAHVPMHCDLRDDPPSANDTTKPRQLERYFPASLHGAIEDLWDKACTPIAIEQGIVLPDTYRPEVPDQALSAAVRFVLTDGKDLEMIRPCVIGDRGMMDFMIDLCVTTKERSLRLFPIQNPARWDPATFPAISREIFSAAIGNLISIWLWMWGA
jgi:hypothetical protein